MNRKYTMDVATVWEGIRRVHAAMSLGDHITATAWGTQLQQAVLKAIAEDTCADPQGCAKAALLWQL